MTYYITRELPGDVDFESAVERTTAALKAEGFGVLTRIDVQETLKAKLDVDFQRYLILGACNPPFAHKALLAEPWIGTMLPCNVVLSQPEGSPVSVAAVDPAASMQAVDNAQLASLAGEVGQRLQRVIAAI